MRICIPVSKSDVSLLPSFTAVLVKHGNLHQHSILLCPTALVEAEAYAAASQLREICPTVDVRSFPDFAGGWPAAPNAHWASVASYLNSIGNALPWFWMELDTVPLQSHWADAWQREYNACGKPFMGTVVPTLRFLPDGTFTPEPGDSTMLGVAMYPSYVTNIIGIGPLLDDLMKTGHLAVKDAFDSYLRWVFARAGVAHTELLEDQWDTGNYVRNDTWFTGVPLGSRKGRARSGVVPQSALLVHGCKDDTLVRLALGEVEAKDVWGETKAEFAAVEMETVAPVAVDAGTVAQSAEILPKINLAAYPRKLLEELRDEITLHLEWDSNPSTGKVETSQVIEVAKMFAEADAEVQLVTQITPEPPKPNRFILGPVTPEEEAAFPCTKQQMVEWLKAQGRPQRLRAMQEKFDFKNLDHARRAIGHWGYKAPSPHTYISKIK